MTRAARWWLSATLASACLPPPVSPVDDAWVSGDVPEVPCGHRDTPCCAGDRACREGARCQDGRCVAQRPRCVATGIADPRLTEAVSWEEAPVAGCAAIPPMLLDPSTRGFYDPGDRAVGLIECEGLAPGPRRLLLHLHIRMLAPRHATDDCLCGGFARALLELTIDGRDTPTLPTFVWAGDDGSCRRGIDQEVSVPVNVSPHGNFSARLDLLGCERQGATRCLFARGTSMELAPAP